MAARKQITDGMKGQAIELRGEGKTVDQVADALGISFGTAQKLCRGIARPSVGRAEGYKGGSKKRVEGSSVTADTSRVLERTGESERVVELAGEVKEAELEARKAEAVAKVRRIALAEEEGSRREEDAAKLRQRVAQAEAREAEARALSYSGGGPEVTTQLEAAKAESARLREDLQEARHKAELETLQHGFQTQIDSLKDLFKDKNKNGKSSYDVMSQLIDKVNQVGMTIGSKVDSHLSQSRRDSDFEMALKFGLSPDELLLLKAGPQTPLTRAQYDILRDDRSEADYGSFEWWIAETELHNQRFRELSARVSQRLATARGGGPPRAKVVMAGQSEQSEPAQAEAVAAGSKVVDIKCSHCGKLVSLDLLDPGVKASALGRCPLCQATLDLSTLTGVKTEREKPE